LSGPIKPSPKVHLIECNTALVFGESLWSRWEIQ
jgi:hypothetical protein